MYLQILSYIQNKDRRLKDLEEIFFSTAKRSPQDPAQRENFFYKYAKAYCERWPDDTFFACDLETNEALGYLVGCRNSTEALELFKPLIPSYTLFEDLFKKYPAHLHMNVHPGAQGHGAGSFLLQEYLIELRKFRVKGVHIVTAPEERNVRFYTKHKFNFQIERELNGNKYLFMARKV